MTIYESAIRLLDQHHQQQVAEEAEDEDRLELELCKDRLVCPLDRQDKAFLN